MLKIEIPEFEIAIIVFTILFEFLYEILSDVPCEISIDVLVVVPIGAILRHIRAEMDIVLEFACVPYQRLMAF